MARARQVEVAHWVRLGDEEVDVVATFSVTPGCAPYWDRQFGMMLPGDPMECELVSARREDTGADVADLITQDDLDRLSERAADGYGDDERDAA